VFMHAYRYPEHERRVAALAREVGFAQVSASHQVSPLIKLVSRGDTTVVDAYLSPILRRYVAQVADDLSDGRANAAAHPASEGEMASATSFPPPLWGRDREGGPTDSESATTPLPTPPPQGGREQAAASGEIAHEREPTRLMFMMSSGGLTAADLFQGKD